MRVNSFMNPRVRSSLTRVGLSAMVMAAVGVIGFGSGVAGAVPTLVDDPVPAPSPVAAPAPAGAAPAGAAPAAGVNAANSFLQMFNSMLDRVVPGASSMMPSDVSSLTPPADASAPGAPGPAPAPGAVAPQPGQTLAGAPMRTGVLR